MGKGKHWHSFVISSAWTSKQFHLSCSLTFQQGAASATGLASAISDTQAADCNAQTFWIGLGKRPVIPTPAGVNSLRVICFPQKLRRHVSFPTSALDWRNSWNYYFIFFLVPRGLAYHTSSYTTLLGNLLPTLLLSYKNQKSSSRRVAVINTFQLYMWKVKTKDHLFWVKLWGWFYPNDILVTAGFSLC